MANLNSFMFILLLLTFSMAPYAALWCPPQFLLQKKNEFKQKTDRFWEYQVQSNTWVELKLPFDLLSCSNDTCTKVGTIDPMTQTRKEDDLDKHSSKKIGDDHNGKSENLGFRKRVSVTRITEASIWVTGESGSIYERFWNGIQWVIAPHEFPVSYGRAISVLTINQTILALSEAGKIYQMQLSESSLPVWIEFVPTQHHSINRETDQNFVALIKSAVVSKDEQRVYFCTKKGLLLELNETDPPRWINHGKPPGEKVAAMADGDSLRPEVVYTISSSGGLYEYDRNSKPSWKKHVRREGSEQDTSVIPSIGLISNNLNGAHATSIFLITKGGVLVERRLHQRKWKWVVHGSPKNHQLSSMTPISHDEHSEKLYSMFFTTAAGYIFEYPIPKYSVKAKENQDKDAWVNHEHPPNAKVARGISGLKLQVGRIMFPLDDGRLAELHFLGHGGENSGPNVQLNVRKKALQKYIWSIIDAPESEGWNAEYCCEERGPKNCIVGTIDQQDDSNVSTRRRRKGSQTQQHYLPPTKKEKTKITFPENWIKPSIRLRVMHASRSFFLVSGEGWTFEYLYTENIWLCLRHEHETAMQGVLGNYNGSVFMVDVHGSLFVTERKGAVFSWINCTAMRKGRQVSAGPPWDGSSGRPKKLTLEDALFFVSKSGRLMQFTVAQGKYLWKDCRCPANIKIASIIDQEMFRENIVFVVGRNGRLYQYNKITELWHEHYQSQHLILSNSPGTVMRLPLPSPSSSLAASLFMISEDGGLVEYQWTVIDGWNWIEHGKPRTHVSLVGATGPCFEGSQLFIIGSDGNVYFRFLARTIWKWKNFGFPLMEEEEEEEKDAKCDYKVASTRPIAFAKDSVIFELRDARLAEMRRVEETKWIWWRTIGTPTSLCVKSYWAASAA